MTKNVEDQLGNRERLWSTVLDLEQDDKKVFVAIRTATSSLNLKP
jgi:hypothetical protein